MSVLTRLRPDPPAEVNAAPPTPDARSTRRRVVSRALTVLALALLFIDLVSPNLLRDVRTAIFLRIPVEALVAVGIALILPARARRIVAAIGGALLGALAIGKFLDLGFYSTLARPFNPVLDWSLLEDAEGFLEGSVGHTGAVVASIAAVALALAMLVFSTLAAARLSGVIARHRTAATRSALVLSAVWLACAALGAHLVPGVPIASHSAASLAYDRVQQVRDGIRDREAFAKEASVDQFRATPGGKLLTGLRGKDVIVSFIESYGRSALEHPDLAAPVGAALAADDKRLRAAGFTARSAFMTSPTSGGGSWLAHGTLMSGLWINNQQRYRDLLGSDRLTLAGAFRRADWRTVGVEPGTTKAWPEGKFYGYDQIYTAKDLAYRGPAYTLSTMPDQYTLSAFQRLEHGKADRAPLMAEIPLVSSHSPWAPVPKPLDWNDVGDGSVFGPMKDQVEDAGDVWAEGPTRIRKAYGESVIYSVSTLVSYLERYGDDKTVLVFLGDHQPAPLITGQNATRDVPVTIVARDPAVLDRAASWGWQEGLKPSTTAPVWRMSDFRDRFLTAFAQ